MAEQKFDEQITQLSDLYEEAKDCTFKMLSAEATPEEFKAQGRLTDILVELRDMCAMSMRLAHERKPQTPEKDCGC